MVAPRSRTRGGGRADCRARLRLGDQANRTSRRPSRWRSPDHHGRLERCSGTARRGPRVDSGQKLDRPAGLNISATVGSVDRPHRPTRKAKCDLGNISARSIVTQAPTGGPRSPTRRRSCRRLRRSRSGIWVTPRGQRGEPAPAGGHDRSSARHHPAASRPQPNTISGGRGVDDHFRRQCVDR
jgi:hypothetical protein